MLLPSHPFPVGGELVPLQEAYDLYTDDESYATLKAAVALSKWSKGDLLIKSSRGLVLTRYAGIASIEDFLPTQDNGWNHN